MVCSLLLSSDVVSSKKHKRKVVSIEKKLEICCRHKIGVVYFSLSKEYNLSIHDIIQSEDGLTICIANSTCFRSKKKH